MVRSTIHEMTTMMISYSSRHVHIIKMIMPERRVCARERWPKHKNFTFYLSLDKHNIVGQCWESHWLCISIGVEMFCLCLVRGQRHVVDFGSFDCGRILGWSFSTHMSDKFKYLIMQKIFYQHVVVAINCNFSLRVEKLSAKYISRHN